MVSFKRKPKPQEHGVASAAFYPLQYTVCGIEDLADDFPDEEYEYDLSHGPEKNEQGAEHFKRSDDVCGIGRVSESESSILL